MRAVLIVVFLGACVGDRPTSGPTPRAPVSVPMEVLAPGPVPVDPAPAEPAPMPAEPAPMPAAPRPAPAVTALSSAPASLWACETDADCVVECDLPGECCGAPCGCQTAVNRHVLAELKTQPWVVCSKEERRACPAVACAYEPAWGARCHDGRCRSLDRPEGHL